MMWSQFTGWYWIHEVGASAYTATVAASESANTATMNVHVEVTLSVNTSYSHTTGGLKSANAGYTINNPSEQNPGQFAIGEAVRVVGADITSGTETNPVQLDSGTESGTMPAKLWLWNYYWSNF